MFFQQFQIIYNTTWLLLVITVCHNILWYYPLSSFEAQRMKYQITDLQIQSFKQFLFIWIARNLKKCFFYIEDCHFSVYFKFVQLEELHTCVSNDQTSSCWFKKP